MKDPSLFLLLGHSPVTVLPQNFENPSPLLLQNEMLKHQLAFLPEAGLPSMPAFLSSLTPPMGDVLHKFDFPGFDFPDFETLGLANQIYHLLPEMGDNISVVGEQLSRSPPPPPPTPHTFTPTLFPRQGSPARFHYHCIMNISAVCATREEYQKPTRG